MHIARAYGVTPTARPQAPAAPAEPSAPGAPSKIDRLVAGTVNVSASPPPSVPDVVGGAAGQGPFQLYTRAADRIEAAVAVQIGRSIDVRG
ncbi:MAG: hypothetical protein GY715_06615 [Planctomycetes bacterium]|nr:hypothetical protein [Planctomycetota bacterium]